MAIIRCEKGHYFDETKFSKCPHCGVVLKPSNEKPKEEIRESLTVAMPHSDNVTVAMNSSSPSSAIPGDDQKTIGLFSKSTGNDFVTGWIVCIEGPEKGRDYRLHHGFNRIGRSFQMDVCIVDDENISRDGHCSIVYDHKENEFSILPGTGTITYLDDVFLEGVKKINSGNIVKIGNSKFTFIAFCKEERKWEEE